MNMKKTIAAVAACAMAVSAMATTVSAVDENATEAQSVHYDLTVKEVLTTSNLTFVAKDIQIDAEQIAIYYPASAIEGGIPADLNKLPLSKETTVVVADLSTKQNYTFTFTADAGSKNYDGTTKFYAVNAAGEDVSDTTTVTDHVAVGVVYRIDLKASAQGQALLNSFAAQTNTAQVDVTVTHNSNFLTYANQAALSSDTASQKIYCQLDAEQTAPQIVTAGSGKTANGKGEVVKSDVKQPMFTSSNTASNKAGTTEIFGRLGSAGTRKKISKPDGDNGAGYENVSAVVNDMIANYDDVVFTFNTATDSVFTKAWLDKNDWYKTSPREALAAKHYYSTGLPTVDSWAGDDTFKSFPQHLYNLFGDEGTGYKYSEDYAFNNLFNAALVANNGLTMNQSNVQPFTYSKTSVSFSWSDMTGGNAFVSPASAVTKLQLATSSDWYWDSMDVTAYTIAADDASTDAGANDDGEDLDDAGDDASSDDIDDGADDVDADDTDDVDADDTDDVDADDTDAADDTTDAADDTVVPENPATGNAPIALAVIPVALAAAAVVAKKRG